MPLPPRRPVTEADERDADAALDAGAVCDQVVMAAEDLQAALYDATPEARAAAKRTLLRVRGGLEKLLARVRGGNG